MTKPIGVNDDPNYSDGSGSSVVRYAIPLSSQLANAASVVATLYYQSIPPYYLRQRGESASGSDTDAIEEHGVLPEREWRTIRRYRTGGCKSLKRARRSPAVI